MPDFLLEIGLEEIPARMIPAAEAELLRRTLALFGKEALLSPAFNPVTDARSYSTPRRLAVFIRGVDAHQSDITEETTGPAVKIAFKDGVPTPAAEAFARKSGVAVADLRTISTPKGEYLAATSIKKGRSASEVIASELPKEIAALYWAKNMRWIPGSTEKFVRPVLWIACILGDTVVPVSFAGKTAGRASYGHRVLSSGEPFEIQTPASYLAQLEGEYVLADVEARRHKIRKALDHVTRAVPSARWREDEPLVDAVTHLTEWPDVLLGDFEPAYLTLPEEVLVTVMRDHQKYFAVEFTNDPGAPRLDSETWDDAAKGKPRNPLAPHFLTVTNIALNEENAAIIKQGNERVLRARFNDARFFWEFDQRISMHEREQLLKSVMFQKDIGTYFEKSDALVRIVRRLATDYFNLGNPADDFSQNQLELAARLAKVDLTTELVKEFTELQGQIGGLYANAQGFSKVVSDCLYWQYEPKTTSSVIPSTNEAQILSLADRINTIVEMFAIGNIPTGSKDPFSLRRSANGIVKILAESGLPMTLANVIDAGILESKFAKAQTARPELESFFRERVEFYLRDVCGFSYDVVTATLAAGEIDIRDAVARAQAVTSVRGNENFQAVSASFKRMKNILTQARDRGDVPEPQGQASVHPAELALMHAAEEVSNALKGYAAYRDYVPAFETIATLRPHIDKYFEDVMVLDPNPIVRKARLYLLGVILSDILLIADLSEIVSPGSNQN